MRFGYTIIYVNNVEQALKFYEKAFGLQIKFLHESHQYGEMETGSTVLAFASADLAKQNGLEFNRNHPEEPAAGFEIGFTTEDVEASYQTALQGGAIAVKAPCYKPWGQTIAYVRDINGVLVEICSPLQGRG